MKNSFDLNVNILEVKRFVFQTKATDKRIVSDYELDYCLSGSRECLIDDESFKITEGTMVFRKPGQAVSSTGDYDMYCLTLNFDMDSYISPMHYQRTGIHHFQKEFHHPLIDNIPTHFNPHHHHDYLRIFEKLILASYKLKENPDVQNMLINELFYLTNADIYQKRVSKYSHINSEIETCCQYINANFHKSLTLPDLAQMMHLSPNYFLKLFKSQMGITPKEYILQIRLDCARSLLSGTDMKISAIASECGFNDTSYFSMFFKKRFGITPAEYRQSQKQR